MQAPQVLVAVQTQGGLDDQMHVEGGEVGAARGGQAVDALFEAVEGVLGGEHQHRARTRHGETAQAVADGADGDGKFQYQPNSQLLGRRR